MALISTCVFCQTSFTYNQHNTLGRFCSSVCSGKYRTEVLTPVRVQAGEVRDRHTLKKYLIRTRGELCESCGLGAQWNHKPLALHVDHIDGDSDNNLPTNIRLLCPNCHSQTDTFSGRNKKNSKRSEYMAAYRQKKRAAE